jgi:hypothetical protein
MVSAEAPGPVTLTGLGFGCGYEPSAAAAAGSTVPLPPGFDGLAAWTKHVRCCVNGTIVAGEGGRARITEVFTPSVCPARVTRGFVCELPNLVDGTALSVTGQLFFFFFFFCKISPRAHTNKQLAT